MATIFCFTSTGNSLYTAKRLAEKIGGKVMPMNQGAAQSDDDLIGFVFPNYFWGLPRIVERFATEMRISNKYAYVFAVVTCGGPGFGELGRLKQLLRAKGIRLRYGVRLIMGSNYIPNYKALQSGGLQQKVDDSIIKIADAVNSRESVRISSFTIINKVITHFYPNESSDRYFTVAPICAGCMTCQKICPMHNITMECGKPEFQHRCEHCLACLHHCPSRAIDWKEKTQGKERYRNTGIPLNELIAFHRFHNCGEAQHQNACL